MALRSLSAAIVALVLALPTPASALPQRDSVIPKDWTVFRSEDFGVAILLPGEARFEAPPGKNNGLGNRLFLSAQNQDIATLVMRLDFPQGAGFDEAQLRAALDVALDGGVARTSAREIKPRVDTESGGFIGREMTMLGGDGSSYTVCRAYYVPGYIYCVLVVSRSGERGKDLDRLLNSLEFLRVRKSAPDS